MYYIYKGGDELKLNIPHYVKDVMDTLNKNGYEAYVVGGAVRDAILGLSPDDWDVTTNALTDDVKRCFDRHFETGVKHGTITVLMDKKTIEVTTYRIDGEYRNNRRPESVSFTSDIKDDLKRRDFTINAMAYNDVEGLMDLYGGVEDLKKQVIRCVGDADTRFNEDALRMLRAIRFAARLDFAIDEQTFCSIKRNCHLLTNISAERIQTELVKMLETGDNLKLLFQSGIADIILPEVDFQYVKLNVPCDKELKISALLYNVNSVKGFFNRLKFDNKTKNNVVKILQCSREFIEETDYGIKKGLNKYGIEIFEKALLIMECYGKNTEYLNDIFNKVKSEPYCIKDLAVTGNDIVKLGINGKDVGRVMDCILDEVMKNPSLNSRKKLLDIAMEIK